MNTLNASMLCASLNFIIGGIAIASGDRLCVAAALAFCALLDLLVIEGVDR